MAGLYLPEACVVYLLGPKAEIALLNCTYYFLKFFTHLLFKLSVFLATTDSFTGISSREGGVGSAVWYLCSLS